MSVNALPRLLPYASLLESRPLEDIDLLVVHCTELPDLEIAREYGERVIYPKTGTGNSGHYYIDRDGTTEVWVPSIRVAHHVRGYNHRSVGIELVNAGRYPNWFHSPLA
jgi:N-acetylmuramoyl-L-alanine amidase